MPDLCKNGLELMGTNVVHHGMDVRLRGPWNGEVIEEIDRRPDTDACGGGRGRTGSALACLALLDGVPADEAVAFVREHYDTRAAETPWQRRYVVRFITA